MNARTRCALPILSCLRMKVRDKITRMVQGSLENSLDLG